MYKIGIDIGGTKINIGLFDSNTKSLIENRKILVADVDDLCLQIKKTVDELCESNNVVIYEIESCGVGIPGTVSDDGKRILKAPNIEVLSTSFAGELEKILNIPVGMVQDSRAAAWGEFLCGAAQGAKSVVCITLGTGIGTGIVIDGEIYSGSLGCAGEIGHLKVEENGRACGCGKNGCLEKYCAGGGLQITAYELLGEGKTVHDLFTLAKKGEVKAIKAIENAVIMLGRAIVGVINLLSPEYLLFSGGLSSQDELYLNPLMKYINDNCYEIHRKPIIKKAILGEYAPLYGAAFLPIKKSRKPVLSASIMCADIFNMGKAIREIEDAGIEYLHCDIMDNHFVPNLMLPMEILNKLRYATSLPFDYHIMTEKPETVIEKLNIRTGDFVSVHYESTVHLNRVIMLAKSKGARAAVAINPATPVGVIEEILPDVDMVLLMSVNPGFSGQPIVESSFDKIKKMREYLDERGYFDVLIEVDGNCSFENVPKMYNAGAEVFVVGTSSVFVPNMTISEGTQKLLNLLQYKKQS